MWLKIKNIGLDNLIHFSISYIFIHIIDIVSVRRIISAVGRTGRQRYNKNVPIGFY